MRFIAWTLAVLANLLAGLMLLLSLSQLVSASLAAAPMAVCALAVSVVPTMFAISVEAFYRGDDRRALGKMITAGFEDVAALLKSVRAQVAVAGTEAPAEAVLAAEQPAPVTNPLARRG